MTTSQILPTTVPVGSTPMLGRVLLVLLLGIPYLVAYCAWVAGRVTFDTNDDPMMIALATSVSDGADPSQLVYVAQPLGWLLSHLYAYVPSFAWYPAAGLALQAVSLSILGSLLLRPIRRTTTDLVLVAIYLTVVSGALYLFTSFQFSQVAILAGGIGALGVLREHRWPLLAAAGVVFLLGAQWRLQGALLAALTASVAYLVFCVADSVPVRKYSARLLYVGGLAVVATLAADLLWSTWSPLAGSGTRNYLRFLTALGDVVNRETTANPGLLTAARNSGLSSNDWGLLNSWYFPDSNVFSIERLEAIAESAPAMRFESLGSVFKSLFVPDVRFGWVLVSCLAIGVMLLAIYFRVRPVRILVASVLAFVLLMLLTQGRLPQRILLPWLLILFASLAVNLIMEHGNSEEAFGGSRLGRLTLAIACVPVIAAFATLASVPFLPFAAGEPSRTARAVEFLPENVVLVAFPDFSSLEVFGANATSVHSVPARALQRMILLGWNMQSPNSRAQLKFSELGPDAITTTSSRCVLVATRNKSVVHALQKYRWEHDRTGVDVIPFPAPGLEGALWQLRAAQHRGIVPALPDPCRVARDELRIRGT